MDIITRVMVVTLNFSGKPTAEKAELVGISARHVNRIYAKAIERGFNPAGRLLLNDAFVVDAPRSGRTPKQTDETSELIARKLRRD